MNIETRKKILLILLILALFVIRYLFVQPPPYVASDDLVGQEVNFVGKIVSEPDERETTTRYMVSPDGFDYKVLITAERFPGYGYGDIVEVTGGMEFPENFSNDLGREFDYKNYLAKDDVRYIMYRPDMEVVAIGQGNFFLTYLYKIKTRFIENVRNVLPEPASSLGLGITIGVKQTLGNELLEVFREAGIIHIIVLSGYNMTIILAGVLYTIGRFPKIPRGTTLMIGVILMLLFAGLVGFTATVLRATLMALLAILARYLGRPTLALRTLMIAGFAMLFWNPLILFHDPSFQLSFLATFGLITVSPIIESKIKFLSRISTNSPKWHQVFKEILLATISTQIFVLPALVYMMGQFSIVSLPVNLLVLPLVPTAMILTGVSGVLGFVPILSTLIAFPTYLVLEFIIEVSEFAASIPLASVSVPSIPPWVIFSIYIFYIWYIWKQNKILQSSV